MDTSEEWELYQRLSSLTHSQLDELLRKLEIGSEHIPENPTPSDKANLLLRFHKQKHGNDFSKAWRAIGELLDKKTRENHSSKGWGAVEESDQGELELDRKPRSGQPAIECDPHVHLLCDREDAVRVINSAVNSDESVLVFLIVGDEDQSHDLLVERLCVFELRRPGRRPPGP